MAAASVGLEEQIALVEDAVHVKIKQLVEAHVQPVLELPSATMSVGIADRKKLVDAMVFVVFQEVNEVNALKAMPTCLNFEAVAESMEVPKCRLVFRSCLCACGSFPMHSHGLQGSGCPAV